jgi:hypothetical protein
MNHIAGSTAEAALEIMNGKKIYSQIQHTVVTPADAGCLLLQNAAEYLESSRDLDDQMAAATLRHIDSYYAVIESTHSIWS